MAEAPARKRPKRVVPFLEAHESLYGVRLVERDPATNAAKSVLCMFCAAFGREDAPLATTRKRARTQKPKYWGGPCFRADNYKSHLTMMHPTRWGEYQQLALEAKQSYFAAVQALPKREQQQPRRSLDTNQHAAMMTDAASVPQFVALLQTPVVEEGEPESAVGETMVSAPVSPASSLQSPVRASVAVGSRSSIVSVGRTSGGSAVAPVLAVEGGGRESVLAFLLDRDVVDVALGDVLLRVEDVDEEGSALFESTLDRGDVQDRQRSDGTAEYRAVVRSVELFQRVVTLLAAGLSFEQTAAVCRPQLSQQISRISHVGNSVLRMARVVVGANLQALSRILQRGWAFSLSLHSVDRRRPEENEPHLFIDVRLRAYCSGVIKVFHLLALPVTTERDPSTIGEIIFDTIDKFIQALHKRWLRKVIGCSTVLAGAAGADARSAVSCVLDNLARRVEKQALAGFARVSSGRPPLDVLLQRFVDSVLFADGAQWHGHLMNLLAYLQRQISMDNAEELSAAAKTSCPRISDMSWWKLTEVIRWIDNARVPIQRLLSRRNASVTPPPVWWLNLKIVLEVVSMAIKTRAGLQGGYTTLMSQQPQRISMLRLALAGDLGVEGPLPEFQRAALRDHSGVQDKIGSDDGMFAVKSHSIVAFIRGTGSWAAEIFDALTSEERQKLVVGTADTMLDLVQSLHGLAEELEAHGVSSTASLSSFPPVLPHQVALLHPVDFQEVVRVHHARLTGSFSDAQLAIIETQHRELRSAAASEPAVRQLLDSNAEGATASFDEAWRLLRSRWGALADFCGGLATVFPSSGKDSNVSAVAFSSLPSTHVGSNRKLTDFSLEARLQCQQFATLQAMDETAGAVSADDRLARHKLTLVQS
ncbi:hypothetical protein PF005_g14029 [Phytophthora fragariae]|uniref:Uncharacterized protein n=1 Tax=Phytophthora fragariae TaxID=53985 RepID=A0A6A3Y1S4_9STRA|nr:hypothetical protein PF003_g625 [Phytophthora fragariae]KAE8931438.1 hypothetical protein PF009_g18496 [Phytophthora fragariae]KAE8995745.1 hypothetical protein PF011_g16191 [Phytophthora fragariae]KAE9094923.1 hypothetical protein PF010_g16905 [Phytophthora fragariae]KAE9095317.1 hypothetical protein PF007_g17418 [Phytophthora fragariae]